MRYFKITVTPAGGGDPTVYTNKINGKADPNAVLVEIDIPQAVFASPVGYARVAVWGVELKTISQASNFNGAEITVEGGMQAGLPLATAQAAQSGLLVKGMVQQAYGFWQNTDQRIEFVIVTDGGASQGAPVNLTLNWLKGQTMADALQQTLSTAYPDYTLNINISDKLVLSADEIGYFQTIEQLAQYAQTISKKTLDPQGTGDYPGVNITLTGTTLGVYDGTMAPDNIQLNAADFIGQPSWLGPFKLQWSMVMRADLRVGSRVKFPQVLALQTQTSPAANNQARSSTTFQGAFDISLVRHIGNSRAPDASAWISTFEAFFTDTPTSATDTSNLSS